jgi:hypothetical protein
MESAMFCDILEELSIFRTGRRNAGDANTHKTAI